jgi:hypothetical protein
MSDFIIPKGKEYIFTVKVMENDSFIPQDLTTMTLAQFELVDLVTLVSTLSVTSTTIIGGAVNGTIEFTLPAASTTALNFERGAKVDGYYLKPTYQAVITVKGSDFVDILSTVDKVYIVPVGV